MAKQKKERNDKFYTKKNIAKKLIDLINIHDYDYVIDPSAGNGAFYNQINVESKIGIDLEPDIPEIVKADWLDFEIKGNYKSVLVIGNPPFGRQASGAFEFINKCAELEVSAIAFILPKSFKKDSFQNRFPVDYHLNKEVDLEESCFELEGKDYPVPCVFQIWLRSNQKRVVNKLKTTSSFLTFVKKSDNPDYVFRRIGANAGNISDDINKSEQSHYFIKSSLRVKKIIGCIEWEHNNTVGPRSIGKGELIARLEKIIGDNHQSLVV